MIGNKYKFHKDNVIDIFNRYKENRGTLNDGVDVKHLETRINTLKKGKYTLAIAGEVKAGKSTFLNALLGAEILPADVLQATSAIVEIFKSEKSYLKIVYASGREETIYDDPSTPEIDEAIEKLKGISKIPDRFRDIPTTLLNQIIISSTEQIKISEDLLKSLESNSGMQKLSDKSELIRQYISEHNRDNIPAEIQFGYPLKWKFDELRIVDTPGVNARGGIQATAYKYFEEANAILFIHPIKPIESESFRTFVNGVISQRSKESLFLILTHVAHYFEDTDRLLNEAKNIYKNTISEEKILAVDSILKLIHIDLENEKSIKKIKESSFSKKQALPYFIDKAQEDNRDIKEVLFECSRFMPMYETIDKFSLAAPNLQLSEILDNIREGYENQKIQYDENIDLLNKKRRKPQEFEDEIKRIQDALEEYILLMKKSKDEIESKFSFHSNSEWHLKTDELQRTFSAAKDRKQNTSDNLHKKFLDSIDSLTDIINGYSTSLTSDLNIRLTKIGKSFKTKHNITPPKVDLKAIEDKAKSTAYRTDGIYETKRRDVDAGDIISFGIARLFRDNTCKIQIGSKQVFDDSKFLDNLTNLLNDEFQKSLKEIPDTCQQIKDAYLKTFIEDINIVIEGRKEALNEEKKRKQTNGEIIKEIEGLHKKKENIAPCLVTCKEILENLK